MKLYKLLLFFLAISCWSAGHTEVYNLEVGQFEKIKINTNVSVVYRNLPDSAGFARYEAPAGNEDLFNITSKGKGTLRIQSNQTQWKGDDLPVLHIYSDYLNSVESSSDQTVIIENPTPCASFSVNQIGNGTIIVENIKSNYVRVALTTGNGTINISGKCVDASFRMLGTGLISADRLIAENVKCSILGTGSIGCWAVDNLNVKGIGSTKIYYKGHPNIKKTGGGKLFELPDNENDSYEKIGSPVTSFDEPEDDEDNEQEESFSEEEEEFQTVVTSDD